MLDKGFSSKGKVFVRDKKDLFQIIKLRKSSFSQNLIIELGVFLGTNKPKDISECYLVSSGSRLFLEAYNWSFKEFNESFSKFEDDFLTRIFSQLELISDLNYLRENFPNNFDHDKWWLENIRESDFINLIKG